MKEASENYITGGESYGLMIGAQCVIRCCIYEVALLCRNGCLYEKDKGRTLFDKLIDLYVQYGFYKEHLISITKRHERAERDCRYDGKGTVNVHIDGAAVVELLWIMNCVKVLQTGEEWDIRLPKSNVLQFILADGGKISASLRAQNPRLNSISV